MSIIVVFIDTIQNQETEVPSDGLRQRLNASQSSESSSPQSHSSTESVQFQSPDPRAFWAGAVANPYASTPGYESNSMPQQLLWMQQAYAHYVTQYMQL
jgi:hypothetical protein